MAETLTGTLESPAGWTTYNYNSSGSFGFGNTPQFRVVNIELTSFATSFIHFDNNYLTTYDVSAPHGAQTSFNMTLGTQVVATGTMGYQRLFNSAWPTPAEIQGYQYYQFDTWNITGLSGTQTLTVNYNHSAVYNMTYTTRSYPTLSGAPSGYPVLWSPGGSVGPIDGLWTFNRAVDFKNDYTATKPSSLGITGHVYKEVGGTLYASRAYIVDGVTSVPITSQSGVTTDDFYFDVPSQTIKICVLDSTQTWYNTSTLFSPAVPTVTPTPTVTPPPTGNFTINLYVKNNGNSTAIPNAYVEVHSHDIYNSIYAGYTDINGLKTFTGVPFPTYASGYTGMSAWVTISGYQFQTYDFTPTTDITHTIYMVPDIGAPLFPATINITVHSIDASNGNANLAGAYVEVYPNVPGPNGVIDWTYKLTGTTSASGLYTFQNVPNGAYGEVKTTKAGYSTDDYWRVGVALDDWTHTAYLTTFGVTPTPTPLPQTGNYKLVISPTSVINGGNTTGTISSTNDPTLAGIQQVWYAYGNTISKGVDAFDFFESGSYSKALQYIKNSSGIWMGWDYSTSSFSNNKGASIPNPANLIFNGPGGTKTVYCTITLTNGTQYDLLGTVVVGQGAAQVTTHIQARDGLGNGIIYNPEIDIFNKNTLVWKNGTYPNGAVDITTPTGTYFDVYGIKAGYANAQLSNIKASDSTTYSLLFFSGVTPSAGNQSLSLWVTNVNGVAIPGASVRITESGTTTNFTGTTGEAGTAQFVLKTSTLYNYNVIRAGYQSASGSFTTSTLSSDVWVVQMVVGVNPTATIPPTLTTTPTIIPTNPAGNYTGFWGPLANAAQAMGATADLVPLLLAALLIFIGFCVGGWSGAAYSPSSAFNMSTSMAGGVFGFVLSCMFGFISIVWIVSIAVIGIFIFIFFSRV